jgi:ankyrin repeat protein
MWLSKIAQRLKSWTIFGYLLIEGMPIDDETLHEYGIALRRTYHESYIEGFIETVLQSTEISKSTDPQAARLYSLAWDLGVEFGISSIINHNIDKTGSFLDMNDESFFDTITLAIKDDNVEYLRSSFVDARVERYQQAHMEHYTLLHVAASENSFQCLKILLERGFDPGLRNKAGQLPIHACSIDDNEDALHVFIEHHVQTDSKDVEYGASIWHHAAYFNSLQILRVLVKLAVQKSLEALKTTSKLGQTPLSIALQKGNEQAALLLLDYCTEEACSGSQVDLYRFAARIGSEILVNRLSDAGVKPERGPSGNRTPLHEISRKCTLGCLKRICALYPNDSMKLSDGNTAIEEYMLREMIHEGDHADIICELISNNVESTDRGKLAKIWETFVSTQVLGRNLIARSDTIARQDAFDVLEFLLQEGFMRAYEEERKLSGLKPFVDSISQLIWGDTSPSSPQSMVKKPLASSKGLTAVTSPPSSYPSPRVVDSALWRPSREPRPVIAKRVKRPFATTPFLTPFQGSLHREQFLLDPGSTDEAILRIIKEAQYLDTINNDPPISRLLKLSIRKNSKKLCRELLRIGVPVHSDKEESALMRACSMTSKCDGELFEDILEYADKDKLDDIPLGTTRACIHLLGQPGVTDSKRKLEALVKAGANPNQITRDDLCRPALVDYLLSWRGNSKISVTLLHLGANPLLKATDNYDASLSASLGGQEEILQSLFEYQASAGVNIQWTGRSSAYIAHIRQSFADCSALHLAALGNRVGCAQFYLHKKLITDVDIEAANGITPLHFAAHEGCTEMVQFLLDQGANINARAFNKLRPIDLAIQQQRTIVVKLLAQKGEGNTPLQDPQSMRYSNTGENLPLGSFRYASRLPVQTKGDQASVLEYSITQGNLKMGLDMIKQGCSTETKMPSCHACTPLLHAVRLEEIDIANMLLDNGARTRPIYCPEHAVLPPPEYESTEGGVTAVDVVCQTIMLTKPLLQRLMDRYIQGGGAWLSSLRTPLSTAIAARNDDAFLGFLIHVENNAVAHM